MCVCAPPIASFIIIPDMLKNAPMFKSIVKPKVRRRGWEGGVAWGKKVRTFRPSLRSGEFGLFHPPEWARRRLLAVGLGRLQIEGAGGCGEGGGEGGGYWARPGQRGRRQAPLPCPSTEATGAFPPYFLEGPERVGVGGDRAAAALTSLDQPPWPRATVRHPAHREVRDILWRQPAPSLFEGPKGGRGRASCRGPVKSLGQSGGAIARPLRSPEAELSVPPDARGAGKNVTEVP